MPHTVLELHMRLNEAETLLSAPFGHHDSDEQLFNSHAWYSLTMLAALELPDVPSHALLSTWTTTTTTALQDMISKGRARFVQATFEQPSSTPTISEVCEALQRLCTALETRLAGQGLEYFGSKPVRHGAHC